MADNKRQTNGIKIGSRLLTAIAVVAAVALLAAIYVVPRYGKTLEAYKSARSEFKAAEAGLAAAKQENADLTQKLDEMKSMKAESDQLSSEVFKLAAQLEQDIRDGKSDKKIWDKYGIRALCDCLGLKVRKRVEYFIDGD